MGTLLWRYCDSFLLALGFGFFTASFPDQATKSVFEVAIWIALVFALLFSFWTGFLEIRHRVRENNDRYRKDVRHAPPDASELSQTEEGTRLEPMGGSRSRSLSNAKYYSSAVSGCTSFEMYSSSRPLLEPRG